MLPFLAVAADNFVEDVHGGFQCEVQKPYVLYRNRANEVRACVLLRAGMMSSGLHLEQEKSYDSFDLRMVNLPVQAACCSDTLMVLDVPPCPAGGGHLVL